ncbi:MAG: AMP-binding protein, partial [Frankiaceae bacterium]|nr:AMP-binding protein [Frankiaceae bacterium]
GVGDLVTIAFPSERSFVIAMLAAWSVGATPQPVAANMPAAELAGVVEVAQPSLVVGTSIAAATCLPELPAPSGTETVLPDVTSPNWKAPMSGGSTGKPKVIVAAMPAEVETVQLLAAFMQMSAGDVALVTAPLHHNGPFLSTIGALGTGGHAILPGRFDAETTLQLVERHAVQWMYLVPTMMSRITKLGEARDRYDVSSLNAVMHMAAPCPPHVKLDWIEWLGGEKVWELYAGTEAQAATLINGLEWLEHRGSVGRCVVGEMEVTDAAGNPLPPGEVGEVWLRSPVGPTYKYLGATARGREGGWESLGDLGWKDADGYLYLADRMTDMVLVGGSNVYPAEVEAALDEHPSVMSSAVIGLPDDDLGNRLHAIVQLDREVSDDALAAWCRERLTKYKVPRTFERVDEPLRDEASKVRRSQLRADRLASANLTDED